MKVINTIISSNIYLVEKDEIKNIELKRVKNSAAFFVPTISNTTAGTSILQVNFQTDNSQATFVFQLLIMGPSRTIQFYLNDAYVQGPTINSSGIYKIAPNGDQVPIISKLG